MPFRHKALRISSFLLVILCWILTQTRQTAPVNIRTGAADSEWASNSIWDDGQAEVARYQAKRIVYGKPRSFDSFYITVKEDFSPKYHVKADATSENNIPVLKLHIVSTIPTENYDYRYLTSVFVSRNNPMSLIKLTSGSQEWCGNTFKEVKNWEAKPAFVFHSYFDGEGDGTLNLDLRPGDLLEDQLPIALRSLPFKAGYQFKTRVADSLISNRAKIPQLSNVLISVPREESLGEWKAWKVEVRRENLLQTYWFEQSYPNIMVKLVSSDGRELLLKERTRRKFWMS